MTNTTYRVLARKYRPCKLMNLAGQDVAVRILSNAIARNRIHHALLFTGTRGIGKTTTARIIALSANCIGKDGLGSATVDPCLQCCNCVQILNCTHPDVIELDAASKTGVDSMREIIDGCIYPPMLARYKIYIIDEVHMLSKAAFNALLKTLEEPPERVKFIFATTEIKKVPITILSRCQKFYLRSLTVEEIKQHLQTIAKMEDVKCEDDALDLLARAADGSVRDSLSLLDQAIALAEFGTINLNMVEGMLMIADMSMVCDVFSAILNGDTVRTMNTLDNLINCGHDVATIISHIMEIVSVSTRCIACNTHINRAQDNPVIIEMINRCKEMLSMPMLLRMWQILVKSLEELRHINDIMVLEMMCIKLLYSSSLPTPMQMIQQINAEIVKKVDEANCPTN